MVHGLLSSQLSAAPARHVPVVGVFGVLQLDVAVHWLAAGQTWPPWQQPVAMFACTQPLAGSQLSVVHGLLSSQFGGAEFVHPVAGRHAGGLQALPGQTTAVPVHTPFVHWSPVVHALPSSQAGPVSGALTHPVAGLQLSAVHGLLSSQVGGVPATHPVVGLQVSMPLQALPSLQLTAVPVQIPPVQASPVVHMLLSLHGVPFRTGVFEHVLFAQLSVVQVLLSLQGSGFTTAQRPLVGSQAR